MVETPVERQVTLTSERVVVERRKPVGETPRGEILTEVTVEVAETAEVPVVGKRVRLREEIVVRTERTQHVETVRETLRRDEVEIQQPGKRRAQQLRAVEAEGSRIPFALAHGTRSGLLSGRANYSDQVTPPDRSLL